MRLCILLVFIFSEGRKEITAVKQIANKWTGGGGKGG